MVTRTCFGEFPLRPHCAYGAREWGASSMVNHLYRFAMLALRKRWALPGRYVGAGGFPRGTGSGEFCGNTMQQYDHIGRPAFIHYNLLKQIPSGVYRGFSWGRTKQVVPYPQPPAAVATFASGSTSDTRPRRLRDAPYPDIVTRSADDVEADMLANADDDGWTIYPGSEEVRRRAALERGIRPFFHGGVYSALCIDLAWEDPAPKDSPRLKQMVKEGDVEKLVSAPNPLGINWDTSPLEVCGIPTLGQSQRKLHEYIGGSLE
jgi:alpha 1,2-mannosyltransferase